MEASFELLPIDAAMEIISMLTKIHGKFEHFATKIATNPQRQKAKSPCKSMTYKGLKAWRSGRDSNPRPPA